MFTLRTYLLSLSAILWSVAARAQDELAKVQAGDEVMTPVAHHASSPVPQFDPSSFPGQLFWLAITFALLYLVMSRIVLPRIGSVIESRESHIARDLQQAQADRQLAGELLAAHEAQLVHTRSTAQAAVATAQADAAKALSTELATQDARLATQLGEAEARIAASRTDAMRQLAPAAAQATQAVIARLTGRETDAARAEAEVTKALRERSAA